MGKLAEDPRLIRLTKISPALPEAARQCSGRHAAFLVRKRTFAYFLDDHHGDGIVAVTCKVLPGDNTALAAAQPDRFYLPAYIGPRGWVALRLDVDPLIGAKWLSWCLAAIGSSRQSGSPRLRDARRKRLPA